VVPGLNLITNKYSSCWSVPRTSLFYYLGYVYSLDAKVAFPKYGSGSNTEKWVSVTGS